MPTTYINFHAQVTMQTVQNLMAAISHKLMAGSTEFYFLISTPGGHVMSGLTLYNFLRSLPVPFTMHNVGNVDSIGNAIFVAADTRVACAHSTFMFHGVGIDIQNARFEEKNAREVVHSILADQKRIADILVERTNLTLNQARKLFREAQTKDAVHARSAGLVSDIRDAQIPPAPISSRWYCEANALGRLIRWSILSLIHIKRTFQRWCLTVRHKP